MKGRRYALILLGMVGLSSAAYSAGLHPFREPGEIEEKQPSAAWDSKWQKASSISTFKLLPLLIIRIYQIIISPQQSQVCNFSPSCSHYGYEAIRRYGPLQGILMVSDRLQRCHYCAGGEYHPSPEGRLYDPVQNHCLWESLDNLR
jgi:hypothetical protein